LKVIFVSAYYPPYAGGGSTRAYYMAYYLSKQGCEVTVLTNSFKGKDVGVSYEDRIRIFRVPILLGNFSFMFRGFLFFIAILISIILYNTEIVIASIPPGDIGVSAFFASKLLGKKIIYDVRDQWEDAIIKRSGSRFNRTIHKLFKKMFNVFYVTSFSVVTVTPPLLQHIKSRRVAEDKISLLPNGVDLKVFRVRSPSHKLEMRERLGLKADDFVLIYAGLVGNYYRVDILIRAIYKLVSEERLDNIKFIIVGDGPSLQRCINLTQNLKLQEHVFFLGKIAHQDVAKILNCADVGIIPYDDSTVWKYAYPTKFFEYCASGLPVIVSVTKEAHLAHFIKTTGVGLIVEPLNVDQLVDSIKYLYKNTEVIKKMIRSARNVIRYFDREKIVFGLKRVLETGNSMKIWPKHIC